MPLVAAAACPHTPQLLVRPDTEDRAQVLRVHQAYRRVRDLLAATRPDAIAVVAGDHIEAFFLDAAPAFAVHAGARAAGAFGRYRYDFPVAESLARAIVEEAAARDFDLLYTQDVPLDYAFYVPLHFVMPEPAPPIVPLYVNVYLPPQPTPRRCYAWGRALRQILDARPERVALLASGGLSHFPGSDRYGSPDYDFDRRLLAALEDGRGGEVASSLTGADLDRAGNVELRTWITLLGAVGDVPAEVVCYEPSWHHGNAVVTWPVTPTDAEQPSARSVDPTRPSAPRGRPSQPAGTAAPGDPTGGLSTARRDERFVPHYAFPPAHAYGLNRCLFRLKSDTPFRARFLTDPEAAMTDAGLADDSTRGALAALDRDRLVGLGAHPYLVFMADLRLRMDRSPGTFEYF